MNSIIGSVIALVQDALEIQSDTIYPSAIVMLKKNHKLYKVTETYAHGEKLVLDDYDYIVTPSEVLLVG